MRDYHCHKSYNNLSINIYKRQNVRAAKSECGVKGMMNRDCQLGRGWESRQNGKWWWKWAWHGTCWRVAFKCKTLQKFILSHYACICTVCTHSNSCRKGWVDGGGGVALNWGQMGYFGWFGLEFPFDVVAIAIETVTATETETGCQAELTQLRVLQVSLSLCLCELECVSVCVCSYSHTPAN